jgi:hypothetical protein
MAFKNEEVSAADIDRYNLPFQKGSGRWWTRDAERDYYLWGGLSGNPAFGIEQVGKFQLYVNGETYEFVLQPAESSPSLKDKTYFVHWEQVIRISPEPDSSLRKQVLISILKEALVEYGYSGEYSRWADSAQVVFSF